MSDHNFNIDNRLREIAENTYAEADEKAWKKMEAILIAENAIHKRLIFKKRLLLLLSIFFTLSIFLIYITIQNNDSYQGGSNTLKTIDYKIINNTIGNHINNNAIDQTKKVALGKLDSENSHKKLFYADRLNQKAIEGNNIALNYKHDFSNNLTYPGDSSSGNNIMKSLNDDKPKKDIDEYNYTKQYNIKNHKIWKHSISWKKNKKDQNIIKKLNDNANNLLNKNTDPRLTRTSHNAFYKEGKNDTDIYIYNDVINFSTEENAMLMDNTNSTPLHCNYSHFINKTIDSNLFKITIKDSLYKRSIVNKKQSKLPGSQWGISTGFSMQKNSIGFKGFSISGYYSKKINPKLYIKPEIEAAYWTGPSKNLFTHTYYNFYKIDSVLTPSYNIDSVNTFFNINNFINISSQISFIYKINRINIFTGFGLNLNISVKGSKQITSKSYALNSLPTAPLQTTSFSSSSLPGKANAFIHFGLGYTINKKWSIALILRKSFITLDNSKGFSQTINSPFNGVSLQPSVRYSFKR